MKTTSNIFLTILVAALVSFGVVRYMPATKEAAQVKESALERVLRTNTLRCGYYNFPPMMVMYDDNGKPSHKGFSNDMMEAIAQKTGLKIEWAEEITFSSWPESLQAGRIDAVCTPVWPDAALGRAALFTKPMFYSTLSPMVRADDARFADDIDRLNAEDVTFVVQDGNSITPLTKQLFPKAKILAVAANVDGPSIIQNIVTKKADAILLDLNGVLEYNKRSEQKMRLVANDRPVKYQPFVMAVARQAPDLREFLDNAIDDLKINRSIDYMLGQWEAEPGLFARKAD